MSNGAAVDPLLLRQLVQRVDQQAAEVAGQRGLTVDQWRMVERLARAGAETMADLTAVLALTGPTTTRVADRLVTWALAYRDVDDTDRRRVVLRLARRGRRLYDELAAEVEAAQADVLAGIDPEQRERLSELLRCALEPAEPTRVR